jgi:ABC transporter transmembrane region
MTAGWFSLLTFGWMNSLMTLGYVRPLEASDLWKLQDHRSAGVIAETILSSFDARRKKADEYNARLSSGEIKPPLSLRVISWLHGDGEERLKRWREKDGKAQPSLTWAVNDAIKWWFWSGGVLKVIADTAQVTTPLVQKVAYILRSMLHDPVTFTPIFQYLINFATDSYVSHRDGIQPPETGKGIRLVIVLVILQLVSMLSENHSVYRTTSTGVLLRGGLITAIYSRSLHLTTRARATLPNGRLVNHISTDVSRIDFCCEDFHGIWTAPILIAICLALLMYNLGPSALAAIFVLVILTPIQGMFVKSLTSIRRKTMVWTDKRVKLLQELLGGMKQIKFFAWEIPFLDQIGGYREREMR